MNPPANFNGRAGALAVLIVVVSKSRTPDIETMMGIFDAVARLRAAGHGVMFGQEIGNADLAGARNTVFAAAYKGGFTHLLFVDADVSWEPGAVDKLLSWPVELVLGAYPKRADDAGYPVRTKPGCREIIDPVTRKPDPNGLLPIDGGPTGFMLIARACMERMVDEFEDQWYEDPRAPNRKAWNVFQFAVRNNKRVTEDMFFCENFRRVGGEVWVDPSILMHHHGDKTYSGRYADHLARMIDYEAKKAESTVGMGDLLK